MGHSKGPRRTGAACCRECPACGAGSPPNRGVRLNGATAILRTMNYANIVQERRGATAWLTLNRPADLNAISTPMLEELIDALSGIASDAAIRVVVVTGAGDKAFCA